MHRPLPFLFSLLIRLNLDMVAKETKCCNSLIMQAICVTSRSWDLGCLSVFSFLHGIWGSNYLWKFLCILLLFCFPFLSPASQHFILGHLSSTLMLCLFGRHDSRCLLLITQLTPSMYNCHVWSFLTTSYLQPMGEVLQLLLCILSLNPAHRWAFSLFQNNEITMPHPKVFL